MSVRILSLNSILTLILLVAGHISFSQDTIYIDPSLSGENPEDGTMQHPFNSWDDLHWNDTSYMNGKVFLQKKGTACKVNSGFNFVKGVNVTFSSYGEGEMPEIISQSEGHIFNFKNCSGIEFAGLSVHGDTNNAGMALPVSCVRFFGTGNGGKNLVINCEFSNSVWGIRLMYSDGITVENCRIHNTGDDGIFAESAEDLIISGCSIYNVNRKWFYVGHSEKEAPGDCIQLSKKSGNFIIKDNYLDRSGTGNKFCLIHTGEPAFGVIEGNVLISPEPFGNGGACLFFGAGDSVIVRNNRFSGNSQGVYSHGKVYLHYNVFEKLSPALTIVRDTGFVFNNVFYHCRETVKGIAIVENNIFYESGFNLTGDYNCCWKSTGCKGANSFVADPQFVDPGNGNFHLKNRSPCIDKGTDAGLKKDFEGDEVPQGKGVDIGAFEEK